MQYPNAEVEYFTNDEDKRLKKWLNERGHIYGTDSVGLIGHSWGGDTAATVVAQGAKVGSLITVDPVSHFPPDLGDVKTNAKNWINVNANPNEAKEKEDVMHSNWIAGMGGAWNNDPVGYADHHYNANMNHTDTDKVDSRPAIHAGDLN